MVFKRPRKNQKQFLGRPPGRSTGRPRGRPRKVRSEDGVDIEIDIVKEEVEDDWEEHNTEENNSMDVASSNESVCGICGDIFSSHNDMNVHFRAVHGENESS